MRMTTLPKGATDLVTQFVRIAHKVLADYIPKKAEPFLDVIGIKKSKDTYNNQELVLGIWL